MRKAWSLDLNDQTPLSAHRALKSATFYQIITLSAQVFSNKLAKRDYFAGYG